MSPRPKCCVCGVADAAGLCNCNEAPPENAGTVATQLRAAMTPTPRDEGVPSDRAQHITFEGCDYCLMSPEDYDALIRECDQLKANYQIAREAACRAGDYQREVTALEARVSILLQERGEMVKALRREHEWSEKLAKRIRDAVYASEELKDPHAFSDLDEDFYNGIAASYQMHYDAALSAAGEAK